MTATIPGQSRSRWPHRQWSWSASGSAKPNPGGDGNMIIDGAGLSRSTLKGQVAIVSGAGQGIGREAARVLARLGAAVVIAEINAEAGGQTEQLIRADGAEA